MDTTEEKHTGQLSHFHFPLCLPLYCSLGILVLNEQVIKHNSRDASYDYVTEDSVKLNLGV